MKKLILLYGISLAALVFVLKMLEYRYFVHDLSMEFYIGMIALLFTVVGVWIGLKLTRKKQEIVIQSVQGDFIRNEKQLEQTGISSREYEVLELMAQGYSNQEIAEKLFVSLNTIKTHITNIFLKLEAKRRTQAVQRAKELQLIP
jgi:DNA-binding CsgD family transcriptional regulator